MHWQPRWLWGWPLSRRARCWRVQAMESKPGRIAARWAVTYTHPLAARWSGAPLGVALHPVQAYAALAFLTLSIFLLFWLRYRQQAGDVAGLLLLGAGVVIFVTEFWRDTEGRGTLLGGALDGPQAAAVALVVIGGLVMMERPPAKVEAANG